MKRKSSVAKLCQMQGSVVTSKMHEAEPKRAAFLQRAGHPSNAMNLRSLRINSGT
jgi:hypothetical protein